MLNTPVMVYLHVEGSVQQGIIWERNASYFWDVGKNSHQRHPIKQGLPSADLLLKRLKSKCDLMCFHPD